MRKIYLGKYPWNNEVSFEGWSDIRHPIISPKFACISMCLRGRESSLKREIDRWRAEWRRQWRHLAARPAMLHHDPSPLEMTSNMIISLSPVLTWSRSHPNYICSLLLLSLLSKPISNERSKFHGHSVSRVCCLLTSAGWPHESIISKRCDEQNPMNARYELTKVHNTQHTVESNKSKTLQKNRTCFWCLWTLLSWRQG